MKRTILFLLLLLAACKTESCDSSDDPNVPTCVGFGMEGGGHVTHPECPKGKKAWCIPDNMDVVTVPIELHIGGDK